VKVAGFDIFGFLFGLACVIFLFYSLNYRVLVIKLTSEHLALTFGIFTWRVPFENIEACLHDEIPLFMRMGGAGIHFMRIDKRYRASFNFLEFPRAVVHLKKKVGPVQDISFTTRQPSKIRQLIQDKIEKQNNNIVP